MQQKKIFSRREKNEDGREKDYLNKKKRIDRSILLF